MTLTPNVPIVITVKGTNTQSYTHRFEKPFDSLFHEAIADTLKYLCSQIGGASFGYTQGDTISVLVADYKKQIIDAQYLSSMASSIATYHFNNEFNRLYLDGLSEHGEFEEVDMAHDLARRVGLLFHARVCNIAENDVYGYFLNQQRAANNYAIEKVFETFFPNSKIQYPDNKARMIALKNNGIDIKTQYDAEFYRGVGCRHDSFNWVFEKEMPVLTKEYLDIWIR